jgi:subtilisin family serine protease
MNNSYADSNDSRKIVVFKENKGHVDKDIILKKHGAIKVKDIKGTDAVVVRVSSDSSLSKEPGVEYIEDDVIVSISKVKEESPSKKPKPKDIQEIEQPEQPEEIIPWGIQYVGAPEIWETNCGEGLKVAVIDTGVDVDHPDLFGNIKGGTNTISRKGSYDDDNGHGTHVAGIIAAVDNEIGVVGVVPEADLYAIKALDSYGNGYVSDIIEGIQWCIENDIDIINMSFGLTSDSQLLHESVIEAFDVGIEMVAAAGNNYGGACEYPAAYDEVVAVGAVDVNGSIAEFSAIDGVAVWAPGVEVYSTYVDSDYKNLDGTSMATPHWILQELKNKVLN